MPGMVLEGGTFRPLFSCGVMQALLEEDIMFPYVIGVSAGISDAISYIAKQKGRDLEIVKKYRHDKRYIGIQNYKTDRSIFGINFVFGEIPEKLVPLDWDTYISYKGRLRIGVTNAETGQAEYLDGMKTDRSFTMYRATCAIPLVFPAIGIDGKYYYDGGVADPIPIRKAIADGNEKNLIVLTRDKEYRKKLGKEARMTAKLMHKKYPAIEEQLLHRHEVYNETVRFCEAQERQGKALIIRPDFPLESFEKDIEILEKTYWHGYELAKKKMQGIKNLFHA